MSRSGGNGSQADCSDVGRRTSDVGRASPWLLYQLADSTFPTGGFAHSAGIEAAVQVGEIRDEAGLCAALVDVLQQWAGQAAPFCRAAVEGSAHVSDLMEACDALLIGNAPAWRASQAQGQALLMAAAALRSDLGDLRRELAAADLPPHLAVAFGCCGRALGLDSPTTLELFAFTTLRSAMSAAVRLNIIGPLAAQALQHGLAADLDRCVADGAQRDWRDAASCRPLFEVWHGHHDRLYSRLFQS